MDRHSPFDIVIDGLNVAKTSVRFNSSEIVSVALLFLGNGVYILYLTCLCLYFIV